MARDCVSFQAIIPTWLNDSLKDVIKKQCSYRSRLVRKAIYDEVCTSCERLDLPLPAYSDPEFFDEEE